MSLHIAGLFLALVAGFAVVFSLAARYGIIDGTLPRKAQGANLAVRRNLALGLALLAIVVYTAARWWVGGNAVVTLGVAGALTLLNIVCMAAAGAMDVWRFKLPLPLTITGIVLSLAARISDGIWLETLIAVFAAIVLSLMWAALTRGGIGWGDYLAIIWIMLALSTNGLLAMLVGQIGLTLFHLRRRDLPVPVGGGYLLAAVTLFAVPFTSLMPWAMPAAPARPIPTSAAPANAPQPTVDKREPGVAQMLAWHASMIAGDTIARVALAEPNKRPAEAQSAARDLGVLQAAVDEAASLAHCPECRELSSLIVEARQALNQYDVDAIREISSRRHDLEVRLRIEESEQAQTNTQK